MSFNLISNRRRNQ